MVWVICLLGGKGGEEKLGASRQNKSGNVTMWRRKTCTEKIVTNSNWGRETIESIQ